MYISETVSTHLGLSQVNCECDCQYENDTSASSFFPYFVPGRTHRQQYLRVPPPGGSRRNDSRADADRAPAGYARPQGLREREGVLLAHEVRVGETERRTHQWWIQGESVRPMCKRMYGQMCDLGHSGVKNLTPSVVVPHPPKLLVEYLPL